MEKKALMLKSIQNLETQSTTENSFNVFNNASSDYLEKVTTSCGIILGSQSQSASEIISAMQAQELVRIVLAKAEKKKSVKGDDGIQNSKGDNAEVGENLDIIDNELRGCYRFHTE